MWKYLDEENCIEEGGEMKRILLSFRKKKKKRFVGEGRKIFEQIIIHIKGINYEIKALTKASYKVLLTQGN